MNSTNPDKDTRDTVLTRDRWRCARCGKPLEISAESRTKAIATYASCGWKLKWDFDGLLAYALCPYCGGLQEKDKRND